VTLLRAALALQREDWKAAQDLYVPLLRQPSPPAEAWYGLGVARVRLGDAETGSEALARAVELEPRSASFRFELGRAWALQRRSRLALRQFVLCLRLNPEDARAWRSVVELLAQRGRTRMAERILQRGRARVPGAVVLREPLPGASTGSAVPDAQQALVRQVLELMGRSRNREALKLVREAKGPPTLMLKLLEAKACESLIQPDVEGTMRAYEEAMALAPEAWEPCNDLGLFLLKQGHRHAARAVELLQEARRRAPSRPEPGFNLAVAFSKQARTGESLALARELVKSLPAEHPFHQHAQALIRKLGGA
jgi:tetratricopeptide (TPR) repeat protein